MLSDRLETLHPNGSGKVGQSVLIKLCPTAAIIKWMLLFIYLLFTINCFPNEHTTFRTFLIVFLNCLFCWIFHLLRAVCVWLVMSFSSLITHTHLPSINHSCYLVHYQPFQICYSFRFRLFGKQWKQDNLNDGQWSLAIFSKIYWKSQRSSIGLQRWE